MTMSDPSAELDSSAPASANPTGLPHRLLSLDTYRGLIMCTLAANGLALATTAKQLGHGVDASVISSVGQIWQWLAFHNSHPFWNSQFYVFGCSYWDLIQPSFMFMVGVSMAYSYAGRKARGDSDSMMLGHALYRAVFLILLGVFLRSNGRAETYWTFEDVVTQIGLGYVFLFFLVNRSLKTQGAVLSGILIGYWALFALWPLPGPDFDPESAGVPKDWTHTYTGFFAHWNKNANPAHYFDVWFLNLFPRSRPFLFNGGGYNTLNFIPSMGTMLIGLMAGTLLKRQREPNLETARTLALAGVSGLAIGLILDWTGVCPLVKRIWTPGFTLFGTGWCLLFLAALYLVIDFFGQKKWAFPAQVVGLNSITMYMMTWLVADWIRVTLLTHLGEGPFQVLGSPLELFLQNLVVAIFLWLICFWMYKRRIFLRI